MKSEQRESAKPAAWSDFGCRVPVLSEDIFALQIPNNFDHLRSFVLLTLIFVKREVPWLNKQ